MPSPPAAPPRALRRLAFYLRPYQKTLTIAVVCMVLSGALAAAFLFLFQNVLAQILQATQPDKIVADLREALSAKASDAEIGSRFREAVGANGDRSRVMGKLNVFIVVVIATVGLRLAVDFTLRYLIERTGQRVLRDLRRDLFGHFQRLSVGFFESRRTGEILSRLTNDLTALQTVLTVGVISAVRSPVEVLGALGFMFYTNWKLSLFVFVVLPPVVYIINRAGTRIRRAVGQLQAQLAELTNYLQEKIAAMRLIQTFGAREHEIVAFERVNEESYRRTMKPIRIQASLGPTIEFIGYMGVMLVLWFGARSGMEAEKLIVFLFAMHRAAMNFKSVAGLSNMMRGAEAAAERLFEMLDTQPQVQDAPDAIDLTKRGIEGHLKFEDVRFSYADGPEVLHGLSFEIRPGEVVALAGHTGSGKSTIGALVPRLYDPTSGRVSLDGLDLRDVSMDSLRSHIGAVPQETTLFHGTIRDNIAYAKPDASDAEVREAARRAHADEFIEQLERGYDTPIGERGAKLSGGQRQRIAIARALLRDPKILILDEATSSLDARVEAQVQDALDELMRGRTTLVIAHRFSTIQNADRILVLERGRVAEAGGHEELLARRGLYWQLYQAQAFAPRDAEAEEVLADGEGGASTLSVAGA